MLYDNTYYLGQVIQVFLQNNPALQDELEQAALSRQDETILTASRTLRLRLLDWLETQSSMTTHHTDLLQIADAFAMLAPCTCDDTVSDVMV